MKKLAALICLFFSISAYAACDPKLIDSIKLNYEIKQLISAQHDLLQMLRPLNGNEKYLGEEISSAAFDIIGNFDGLTTMLILRGQMVSKIDVGIIDAHFRIKSPLHMNVMDKMVEYMNKKIGLMQNPGVVAQSMRVRDQSNVAINLISQCR